MRTNIEYGWGMLMKREIPDLVIIDLEQDDNQIYDNYDNESESDVIEESGESEEEASEKSGFRINMHMILLATAIIVFSLIIYRVTTWGNFISQDDIFSDGPGIYHDETFDYIVPLMDEDGNIVPLDYSDGLTVVAFGNAPFADDRDSENSLANLIAERTGATVYNCSISGSCLTASSVAFDAEISPMDVYCFYWLIVTAFGFNDQYYKDAAEALGEDIPPEAAEVIETLKSIDFNTVDAIIVMYDATDYLMGNPMGNDVYDKDISCFTGSLTASIDAIQQYYPHIRIIVMSPSYAFAIDENGEYISSDVQRYGHDVLSTYSILESNACYSMNVTFVDNLYGSITEDNASEYLSDNLHLNLAGRRLIADRAAYALLYFEEGE